MSDTIALRILRAGRMISATEISTEGQIVKLPVPQAAGFLASGDAEAVDPPAAKKAIDEWNTAVHRAAIASQPRTPLTPWSSRY